MIEFDNVSKRFRRASVLSKIDLKIGAGDRVALVGSNGAGKTTLIRCLLGEYRYEGDISVNGLETRNHRTEILKRVGFVPQLPPPVKMSVGQLVGYAAGLCETGPERIHEVCSVLGLELDSICHQSFNKLSGGQKQKVLIGIALGRDYDLLVLDEPTANLDPQARQGLFRLLAERAGEAAMILSSHRLTEVAALVNRVVELDAGKLVLDDHVEGAARLDVEALCNLVLTRADAAFANAIGEWGFRDVSAGVVWKGRISGADRLRFLGLVSRYSALVKSMQLDDLEQEHETATLTGTV